MEINSLRVKDKLLKDEFVFIPSGEYTIGCEKGNAIIEQNNFAFTVKISRDFFVCEVPITVREYKKFVMATSYPSDAKLEYWSDGEWHLGNKFWDYNIHDDYPVVGVSYYDALEYINWLNNQDSEYYYSIPTECQFEICARYGCSCNSHLSCDITSELLAKGLTRDNKGSNQIRPVKSGTCNKAGIFDMNGLIWQWCLDYYAPYPTGTVIDYSGPIIPPKNIMWYGKDATGGRVIRGGSFSYPCSFSACYNRHVSLPNDRNINLGFRIIKMKR